MATLSIDVPNGERVTVLIAAAAEAGYPATQAGVKAMAVDFLRGKYREQRLLDAQRSVAVTVAAAQTDAEGIA